MKLSEILGEELATQVEAVIKEKGVNLIIDSKEKPEYIPKSRFDEVIGSKNELKTQVGELSGQLEELKKTAKGNEELTKQIEELQKKNGDWESKYKTTLIQSAIKNKAILEQAVDADDIVKFVDLSKLELTEDGSVKGIDEQFTQLKESKKYLFGETKIAGKDEKPNPGGNPNQKPISEMSMDEYAKYWQEQNK